MEVVEPAVKGTLNVLKACSEANVCRAVIVSSCVAVVMNPNWPKGKVLDESCWSDTEYCRRTNVMNFIKFWSTYCKTSAYSFWWLLIILSYYIYTPSELVLLLKNSSRVWGSKICRYQWARLDHLVPKPRPRPNAAAYTKFQQFIPPKVIERYYIFFIPVMFDYTKKIVVQLYNWPT